MDMAFLSSIPLSQRYQSIARAHLAQRCTRRNSSRSIRMSSSEMPKNSSNGLDFEEMAKRLAEELQSREVTEDASLEELAFRYAQKTQVDEPFDVELGKGEIPKVVMRHEPSQQEVEIYTYGACVTKWSIRGDDHLWLSDQNKWEQGGKPIRGGIPLCFPQFGPYGDLVQHGFGRISTWEIVDTLQNADGSVTTLMKLDSNCLQDEPAKWPHLFSAELAVTLSAVGLETKMSVKNIDNKPFSFTFAFHNYFKASRVQDARIFGFEGIRYNDRLDGDRECPAEEDSGAGLLLAKETDRIYLNAPEELALFDFASLKVLKIKKTPTLPNATLWNPFGAEGCDPGWENFVCVEPAVVTSPAVVQPGETWVGAQLLGIE